MKRFIRKALAVVLTCALAFGAVTCFAADGKKYYDYGTYVLLGDSVASGHNDLVYVDSEFKRVDDSYGAYVADTLGVEYIPMACPGFRTIDMRYMLEDDYPGDDYLFHDAHDPEVIKSRIPEYRRAISDAGLITLGIGGNDFGTYLTWVIADIMEKEGICGEYVTALRDLLKQNGIESEKLDKIVELAKLTDSMPELVKILPQALKYGLENFFENWNHVIEDIYALNPDVQLMVIGMFDNGVKNEDDAAASEAGGQGLNLGQLVVDMANTPMKEGAEKYGYIFVDTTGTICDTYHPKAVGHRHIADRILEALPDATFPYTDVAQNSKYFDSIEFMYRKGYMLGTSDTQFSPDAALTRAAFAQALYGIAGTPDVDIENASFSDIDISSSEIKAAVWAIDNGILTVTDGKFSPDGKVTIVDFAISMIRFSVSDGFNFAKLMKAVTMAFNLIKENGFASLSKSLTRAQSAQMLTSYCNY